MSDRMLPLTFPRLMTWILEEKARSGSLFGIRRPYLADPGRAWPFLGGKLEMPFGPAAGPHTQLAQNLAAAYFAGGRFFELKTVQVLDGEDLSVAKPCILAEDEGYNVEWSTELTVEQAFEEYVKAWFAIHVIAREFYLGAADGFQFSMSVGYDLDGIRNAKIDRFIDGLIDAGSTPVFIACKSWLLENAGRFGRMTPEDIQKIPPAICRSAALSTLHGCPPQEIERIARYLLVEKKISTFVKLNPTLIGYKEAREILDGLGYGDIAFGEHHFQNDLGYRDAVPMIKRLIETAGARDLAFGVKLTNTFPVGIRSGELPGKEMYMSGKALYPLAMAVSANLSADCGRDLRISFSGGADFFNIEKIVDDGIWPVTMATTLLKPGGCQRLTQLAETLGPKRPAEFDGVDAGAASSLALEARTDRRLMKAAKPRPDGKIKGEIPLVDCFAAPCQAGCPIGQDINAYMELSRQGRMKEALRVILEKNPLPFITGTICAHPCTDRCVRRYYESPVNIRRTKLEAAVGGYPEVLREIAAPANVCRGKAAIVGGGPAGLAAASFLARGGMAVTVYEKRDEPGGVVRYAIPEFRIPKEAITHDTAFLHALGVHVVTGREILSVQELLAAFDEVVLAVGASVPGDPGLKRGHARNAVDFLEDYKKSDGRIRLGKAVAVVGGGNTAIDAARAAIRVRDVESVKLVYRRTKQYMPADEDELQAALSEGVELLELLSPESFAGGSLVCSRMELGSSGPDGRRCVEPTGCTACIRADTVISAVGEHVPTGFYLENGIQVDPHGRPVVNPETLETSIRHVYVIGDGLSGPASVVEAIRDARKAADGILNQPFPHRPAPDEDERAIGLKRGILTDEDGRCSDSARCLSCGAICENCVEVCPNRANVSIRVPGMAMKQVIHLDDLCNECGNCRSFCPYDSSPYLDKLTIFSSEAAMARSQNPGFVVTDISSGQYKTNLDKDSEDIHKIIRSVMRYYPYLLPLD
jgi:putative selenate reductase